MGMGMGMSGCQCGRVPIFVSVCLGLGTCIPAVRYSLFAYFTGFEGWGGGLDLHAAAGGKLGDHDAREHLADVFDRGVPCKGSGRAFGSGGARKKPATPLERTHQETPTRLKANPLKSRTTSNPSAVPPLRP